MRSILWLFSMLLFAGFQISAVAQTFRAEQGPSIPLTFFGSVDENQSEGATTLRSMVVSEKHELIIVVGDTYESLPTTGNPIQSQYSGNRDAYIAVFDKQCNTLLYCSYLGGDDYDHCTFLRQYDEDRYILGGQTKSETFPATGGHEQKSGYGDYDGWMTLYNVKSRKFEYFIRYGGSESDAFLSACRMNDGSVALVGYTGGGIEVSPDAYQKERNGGNQTNAVDGMIVIYSDTTVRYASYYGGSGNDNIYDVASTDGYSVVIAGTTGSTDFAVSENCYQNTYGGGANDAYISMIDLQAGKILYSTYIGGNDYEGSPRLRLYNDRVHIWGFTASPDIHMTNNAFLTSPVIEGGRLPPYKDSYYGVYEISTMSLTYLTYISGDGADYLEDLIPVDTARVVFSMTSRSSYIMNQERDSPASEGSGFLVAFDYRSNSIEMLGNTAFNGWALIHSLAVNGGYIYGAGMMTYRDGAIAREGAYKRRITGIDDAIITRRDLHTTSVEPLAFEGRLQVDVYPNPSNDRINIDIRERANSRLQLHLCDVLGRELYVEELDAQQSQIQLSLREIIGERAVGGGLYFLHLFDGESSAVKPVIIR